MENLFTTPTIIILVIIIALSLMAFLTCTAKAQDVETPEVQMVHAHNLAIDIGARIDNVLPVEKVIKMCRCLHRNHIEYELRRALTAKICESERMYLTRNEFESMLCKAEFEVRQRHNLLIKGL